MPQEEMIARIYEAAALPEMWPDLLQCIAREVGAQGGLLLRHGHPSSPDQMVFSDGIAGLIRDWVASGLSSDDRMEPLRRARHPGFTIDREEHSPEARAAMPIYAEFLEPRGADLAAGTMIAGASEDGLIITMESFPDEPTARRALPRLDALRPHLARAAVLAAELQLRECRAAVEALGRAGAGAAMLGHRGQALAANQGFVDALPCFGRGGRDRLRFEHRAADLAYTLALEAVVAQGRGASIPLRDPDGIGMAALHLVPVAGAARDVFAGVAAIALLARPGMRGAPDGRLLQSLFDLTPTEAAVARAVAGGASVEDIALHSGKSVETVRSHLKRVFSKTATGRQNELAVLLMSFATPSPTPATGGPSGR